MGNLPEKIQQATVAVAIYNPPPGTKAIAIRRQMVELPEVAKALTQVEKYIFAASTKTQICEMDDGALVDTDKPMEKRTFATIGTGHDAGKYDGELIYINTLFEGVFVWHIFEVK